MLTLDKYKQSIREDIENGAPVEILEERDSYVKVFDETEVGREYTIWDPALVNAGWLRDRLIVTPFARGLQYGIDEKMLCAWLADHVDADMMSTLRGIVFMGDADEDYNYLRDIGDFYYELEASELPCDEVGLHWFSYNKVFVHMGNIIETTREMVDNGEIDGADEHTEIGYQALATLVHEIRHLAQANPYIPASVMQQSSDDERDAESYARNIVDRYYVDVIIDNETPER